MLKLLYLTLSMRVFGPRNSAYAVNLTHSRHTYGRRTTREISIEHTSVGLTSLAQLIESLGTRLLGKWFPLQGERVHSLYFWSFQKQNREGGQNKKKQTYQFTQGYTVTFIIHNINTILIYIHTYINCYSQLY